jgi:WD40 repeat protein
MSWSPDGKTLATYGHAGGLCTLDAATGKILRRYDLGLKDYPNGDIRFTDEGKGVAVVDHLGYRVIDLATGKNTVHHPWDRDMYRSLTDVLLSPDGKTFLTCDNVDLNLHRCSDRSLVWTAKVAGKWTAGAAFSPDGKRVAVPDRDQALKVRDAATGKVEFELKSDQKQISNVVFSPDGRRLATLGWRESRDVVVWDLTAKLPLARIADMGMGMTRAAFSPDNTILVVTGGTDDTFVIDAKTGKTLRKFRTWPSTLSLAFGPDGKTIFCGGNDGCITRWDAATGEPLPGGPDLLQTFWVRFIDDKNVELQGQGVSVREWATGHEVRSVAGGTLSIGRNVSPDGKRIIDVDQKTAIVRDAATEKEIRRFAEADVPHLWFPQFTPDGKRVIAGSPAGVVFVWDAATGERLHRLDGKHIGVVNGYQLSPSGRLLAAYQRQTGIRGDGAVRLWDIEKGVELKRFTSSRGGVNGVAFSPDETLFVGAGTSRFPIGSPAVMTVWEIATGREVRRIDGHVGEVMAVAVSPDQRLLATGGHDATVRVWEIASGQERQTITAHRDQVSSVAFSPDGHHLATVSSDAPVFIWDLYRPGAKPTAADRDALWDELAKETHWTAMKRLLADPALAVALFRERVTIPPKPDPEIVKARLADLDSQQFATRQKALAELEKLGPAVEPAVRAELDARPGAEKRRQLLRLLDLFAAPSPDALRTARAVEVAERAATPATRTLLEEWANGPPAARLTQEAAAALRRMKW